MTVKSSEMRSQVKRRSRPLNPKSQLACERCRTKKVKCDGSNPCQTCRTRSLICVFSSERAPPGGPSRVLREQRQHDWHVSVGSETATLQPDLSNISHQQDLANIRQGHYLTPNENTSIDDIFEMFLPPPLEEPQGIMTQADQPASQLMELNICDEIQNDSSCFSIYGMEGIKWICSKVCDDTTCDATIRSFIHTIRSSLQFQQGLSETRYLEPEVNLAWSYSQEYFDSCFEASFYTIDRLSFENHIRNRAARVTATPDDSAWYALRNVIYAYGSRVIVSREKSWEHGQSESWNYFENALSVHLDLICRPFSLLSLRALVAMALFSEGAGCPKLEGMLICNAVLLAHSKGLHLRECGSWNLPDEELQLRRWLYWTIYFYEKHLALRSGRPSAIDDSIITCQLPTWTPDSNTRRLKIFTHIVEHAMICSAISKAPGAPKDPCQLLQLVPLVQRLHDRLTKWYENIPEHLRVITLDRTQPGIFQEHAQYLTMAYYGALIALHAIFAHPWNLPPASVIENDDMLKNQVKLSTTVSFDAARELILAARNFQLSAGSPTWMVIYFPFVGALNIFIQLLKDPMALTATSDIALLEISAGIVAYLEFSSSFTLSSKFPSALVTWAKNVCTKARNTVSRTDPLCELIPDASWVYDSTGLPSDSVFQGLELACRAE